MNTKTTEKQETIRKEFVNWRKDRLKQYSVDGIPGGDRPDNTYMLFDWFEHKLQAAVQKARTEVIEDIQKALDGWENNFNAAENEYRTIGDDQGWEDERKEIHALQAKYLSPTQEKCHCLEALSGGKHHEHCMEKSREHK